MNLGQSCSASRIAHPIKPGETSPLNTTFRPETSLELSLTTGQGTEKIVGARGEGNGATLRTAFADTSTIYSACALLWGVAAGFQFAAGNMALGSLNTSLCALYICLANINRKRR